MDRELLERLAPECQHFFEMVNRRCGHLERAKILDAGSKDHDENNCPNMFLLFRAKKNWTYFGLDLETGKNVDIVSGPLNYPFKDATFDAVISNQVFEHVPKPWLWLPELIRICKRGGIFVLATPWKFKIHRPPNDFWRVTVFGMHIVLEELGLKEIECDSYGLWTYGAGVR